MMAEVRTYAPLIMYMPDGCVIEKLDIQTANNGRIKTVEKRYTKEQWQKKLEDEEKSRQRPKTLEEEHGKLKVFVYRIIYFIFIIIKWVKVEFSK